MSGQEAAVSSEQGPASKKPKTTSTSTTSLSSNNNLQSLIYTNVDGKTPTLKVLDQLLVPHEKLYVDIPDVNMAYTVIKTMQIRGTFWQCR